MTYQSFACCNPLNINDEGCSREFKIIIHENKYITQDDIYFNIEYSNINYNKIEKIHTNYLTKSNSIGFEKMNIENLKEYKNKINELIDSTIDDIEKEHSSAKNRQTPLFMFHNIELFVKTKNNDTFISIARRGISGLDDLITNGHLSLNLIFPGIKFKYPSLCDLMIRFTRAPFKNDCLKFECHYNLNDVPENESIFVDLKKKYKEYILPAGMKDLMIEPDVKSFKIVPCVNCMFFKVIDVKDYKSKAENLINEYYNKMKLKYYKDGLEIKESEFGTSPGLYHIELLNEDEFKNKADFYRIDRKFICEC